VAVFQGYGVLVGADDRATEPARAILDDQSGLGYDLRYWSLTRLLPRTRGQDV
jgi:hypothetical protein